MDISKKLQIRNQVEFYFSDSNYRRDAFLRAAAESDPDGFVPISVLLTFNRLKQLTTDPTIVAEAIEESTSVNLSADKLKVKRSSELPGNDDSASRTLYVKGYPAEDPDFTIDTVSKQFAEYGKVLMVKLRRSFDRSLKGSVFIEYDSVEAMQAANAAANINGEVKIDFKGTPFLCVMPYADWSERKKANVEKKSKKESKKAEGEDLEDDEEDEEYEHGLVVKLENLPTNVNSINLKKFIEKFVDGFTFVDFQSEQSVAIVRFGEKSLVEKFLAAVVKGLHLTTKKAEDNDYCTVEESAEGSKIVAHIVEGEEEKAVWDKKKAARSSGDKRRGGGRFGGGGRGRGRGRGRGFKKQRR